jgi:hypothetical protein
MTNRFDRRIDNTPCEWQGPLTDVVDTADAVRLAMEDWGIGSPELLLGLTQLVLHRFDAAKACGEENLNEPNL